MALSKEVNYFKFSKFSPVCSHLFCAMNLPVTLKNRKKLRLPPLDNLFFNFV